MPPTSPRRLRKVGANPHTLTRHRARIRLGWRIGESSARAIVPSLDAGLQPPMQGCGPPLSGSPARETELPRRRPRGCLEGGPEIVAKADPAAPLLTPGPEPDLRKVVGPLHPA